MKNLGRIFVLILIVGTAFGFYELEMHHKLSFASLKANESELQAVFQMRPFMTGAIFFVFYLVVSAVALPVTPILSMTGGAVFGLALGFVLVSIASAIGMTLAFIAARFILREVVERNLGERMAPLRDGLRRDGGAYLFTLRMIPVIPHFIVNVTMALSEMPIFKFYWISQIGLLPVAFIEVNAGTRLAELQSASDILEPKFVISFAVLGLMPLFGKWLLNHIRAR